MNNNETIIALIYDFDKTLCTKDMQEYTFIPNLGIKAKDFWHEVEEIALANGMDKTLAYLYMMIKKSEELGHEIKKEEFKKCGLNIEYFKGVEDWFTRINKYGEELGVKIEHYIISSGNKEIIENSKISKYFKEIFASEFLYVDGKAVWPTMAVNYTTKTQFLVRINKGVLDISDDITLNKKMVDDERRISNKNMIYIGDGITDIPCMTITHKNGGYSIAVYQEHKDKIAHDLLKD
ncbi:MAG: haloacid dehalogenase-like hydrolase, partial [Romboutsia sp.]|nr:haloacid dehalogenase-like hydrolase [Romboutsia sp.]